MAKKAFNKSDSRALKTFLEQAESFEIETRDGIKKTFLIHPLQLGRLALISQRLIDLDVVLGDEDADIVQKLWRICSEKPRRVAEIVAIATLRTKQEIDEQLEERVEELLWSPSMTAQALSNLLYAIVFQSYYADFMQAIRSVRTLRVVISQQTGAERIAFMGDAASGDK